MMIPTIVRCHCLPDKTFLPPSLNSPMEEAGIVSSLKLFWRTITPPSRMPSMRVGMWLSPGRGGPSKPQRRERTRERFISSRGYTRAHCPFPTWTKRNILSSSVFHRPGVRNGTGNHRLLPNTDVDSYYLEIRRKRCNSIFVYF